MRRVPLLAWASRSTTAPFPGSRFSRPMKRVCSTFPGQSSPLGHRHFPPRHLLPTRTLVHGPLHVAHGALGVGVGLRDSESVVAGGVGGGLGRGAELVRQHHQGDARHVRQEGLGGDGRVAASVSLLEAVAPRHGDARRPRVPVGVAWRAVDVAARGCATASADADWRSAWRPTGRGRCSGPPRSSR